MLALTLSPTLVGKVGAQAGGSGLNLSPTRHELKVAPGGKDVIKISLTNVSGQNVIAKVEINDFTSDGDTGQPKIDTVSTDSAASIRRFLKNVTDVELKKDEKKDITINVEVPTDAVAGAYYGVVRYSAIPVDRDEEQKPGEVALNASLGSIVLLEIPGNITEQIQIKSMKVYTGDKNKPTSGTFFTKLPNQVGVTIKNSGNGFSKPFGKINITSNLTNKTTYSYELNSATPKANILPNSERTFKDEIKGVKWPGRYTITASLSSGTSGQLVNYSVSFWYLPIWFIVSLAAVLLALVIGGVMLYRRLFKGQVRRRK
jgi:hypothetical protein